MKIHYVLMATLSMITYSKALGCGEVYTVTQPDYFDYTFVTFSPKGDQLASTSTKWNGDGAVTIFAVSNGSIYSERSTVLPKGADPQEVAFSPDGSLLATANPAAHNVTLFSIGANKANGGISYALSPGSKSPQSLAFSPNGKLLATANKDTNDITLFTLSEGTLSNPTSIALPSGSRFPQSIAFSPDGTLLATANSDSDNVTLFSVSEGALNSGVSYSLPSGCAYPRSLAFSRDGLMLAIANYDSDNVVIFDVTEKIIARARSYYLPSHAKSPQSIAFSPDGSFLAVGTKYRSGFNGLTVFKVEDGEAYDGTVYELRDPANPASVAFSPDGARLAVGSKTTAGGEYGIAGRILVMLDTHNWCPQEDGPDLSAYWIAGISFVGASLCIGVIVSAAVAACKYWPSKPETSRLLGP